MKNSTFRSLVFIVAILCFATTSKAQTVSIPDTAFGSWLNANGYSTCLSGNSTIGWQMDTACSGNIAITNFSVTSNSTVRSLDGVQYLKHLINFVANNDSISAIPSFPPLLTTIDCGFNSLLTVIPALPNGLVSFSCSKTQINILPALPSSLNSLDCGFNAITSLPVLPASLLSLSCESNLLTSIPSLPNTLQSLYCNNNRIVALPALPNSLSILSCFSNQLNFIPNLPDSLYNFDCSGNSNLSCLPHLKRIVTINFSGTGILCLPDTDKITNSTPPTTLLPLCTTNNPNFCSTYGVYPGDANEDLVVNNFDLLPIGLAYDSTGPARAGASIVYLPQYGADWADTIVGGINYKYVDCNGDGIINVADTAAIMRNFSFPPHARSGGNTPWRSGLPVLGLKITKDTLQQGDTLIVKILLGDSLLPATGMYGLAFTLNYYAPVADTTQTSLDFNNSWLGNSTTKISIYKDFPNIGQIKAAVTRIDHNNLSGWGQIGETKIIITTGNINGVTPLHYLKDHLFITNIRANGKDGSPIYLNAGTDSTTIAFTPTNIETLPLNNDITIYPNPASKQITVYSNQAVMKEISLLNVLGEKVVQVAPQEEHKQQINLAELSEGVYVLQVQTDKGSSNKKVTVCR